MLQILSHKTDSFLDKVGDWNPQLLREIKCRFNFRNVALVTVFGVIGQVLFILFFRGLLPLNPLDPKLSSDFNRYCLGSPPPNWSGYQNNSYPVRNDFCVMDFLGHTVINYQLWWLDLFTTLSIIGSVVLLVTGIFLLINDLAQEESKGTLNFLRLSPQPARTIFVGKLLGVPGLLYLLTAITIPLHLLAGLMAGIPFPLIFAFYGILIASCAFFYHLAILIGLISSKLILLQSFASSGSLLFLLFILSMFSLWATHRFFHSPLDWVLLFNPVQSLTYLVQSTFLPFATVGYFEEQALTTLQWYGQSLFAYPILGLGFMVVNYGFWTWALTWSINRRFRSPNNVFISKPQAYLLTLGFIFLGLGFVSNGNISTTINDEFLIFNFIVLQFFLFVFMAVLTIAISPDRPILQVWSRYHHQQPAAKRHFFYHYFLSENSPASAAIALSLAICFLYLTPSLFIFDLGKYRLPLFLGFCLGFTVILLYAIIYQRFLLLQFKQRHLFALAIVFLVAFIPLAMVVISVSSSLGIPNALWFITFLPAIASLPGANTTPIFGVMALLGEWTLILLLSAEMNQKLKKLGYSETKQLSSDSVIKTTFAR